MFTQSRYRHIHKKSRPGTRWLTTTRPPRWLGDSRLLALMFVVLFLLTACGTQATTTSRPAASGPVVVATDGKIVDNDARSAQLQVGDQAPDFVYTLPDGTTQKLSDLRGKKVLVNFWATWCGPCTIEMPDMQAATQRFGAEEFVVLGVNHNEAVEVIEPFARELGLTFPLIANPSGDISNRYGATGLPTSYFINTDGTVNFKQVGLMDLSFIEARVEDMQ